MNQRERLKEIKKYLLNHVDLDVSQACEVFQVSPATIRRDFNILLEDAEIEKTWGGISLKPQAIPPDELTSSTYRKTLHSEEKRKIAEKAASLVKDGDVILVDGGTTTYYMTKYLATKNIRVITNSILIAHKIDIDRQAKFGGAEVFITGGFIYHNSGLLIGPQAIDNIKQYHANVAFLSVGGIESHAATNSNQLIVETERTMIEQSEKVVMLADSSKFGKKSMVKMCDIQEIDIIVTEYNQEKQEIVQLIKDQNVHVISCL